VVVATLLVAVTVWDLSRPPVDQCAARLLVAGIELYRRTLGPLATAIGARCRFEPSCSHYAEAVILGRGALEGSWLAARRLARCGPWTAAGTLDPPPDGP
jgi:putative membrane protein insertion efficiency factor